MLHVFFPAHACSANGAVVLCLDPSYDCDDRATPPPPPWGVAKYHWPFERKWGMHTNKHTMPRNTGAGVQSMDIQRKRGAVQPSREIHTCHDTVHVGSHSGLTIHTSKLTGSEVAPTRMQKTHCSALKATHPMAVLIPGTCVYKRAYGR